MYQMHAVYAVGCRCEDTWVMVHVICFLSFLYPLLATAKNRAGGVLLWQFGIATGNITLLLVVKTDYSVIQPAGLERSGHFGILWEFVNRLERYCSQEHTR